jgi:hypothetical protein
VNCLPATFNSAVNCFRHRPPPLEKLFLGMILAIDFLETLLEFLFLFVGGFYRPDFRVAVER